MTSPSVYLLTLICVLGIAAGQVLFKLSANAMNLAGTVFALRPLALFATTIVLYGITSIGWVLILRYAELGKVYPFMALAFVLVPLASHFFFGEQFSRGYALGVVLIGLGLVCTVAGGR